MAKHSIAKIYKAFLAARDAGDEAAIDEAAASLHAHPDEEAFLRAVERGEDITHKAWPARPLREPEPEPVVDVHRCPICGAPR